MLSCDLGGEAAFNSKNYALKAKKIFSTDLVKVSFLNAVATVISMLTGFVSVKVVAAVIGPVGVALLGQLNNFAQILLSVSNGGINAGITKYTSEYSDNRKRIYSLSRDWILDYRRSYPF